MSVTLRDSFANVLYDDFKTDLAGHWTDRLGGDEMLKAVCERAMELAQGHYKPVAFVTRLQASYDQANYEITQQRRRISELEDKLRKVDQELKAKEQELAIMKEQADVGD